MHDTSVSDRMLDAFRKAKRNPEAARIATLDRLAKMTEAERDMLLLRAILASPVTHETLIARQETGTRGPAPDAIEAAFKKVLARPFKGDLEFMKMRGVL